MHNKNKFIFDVDGTLTPSRGRINEAFRLSFADFCTRNEVYLVTGSDYPKTQEQLGDFILSLVQRSFNCSGSDIWARGKRLAAKSWQPPEMLLSALTDCLKTSAFPLRTGNHIEIRQGLVNLSIVGRNATLGERKLYARWDTANQERDSIVAKLSASFPELHISRGGETSVDVSPKGWDKSQILEHFDDSDCLVFFGNEMQAGGNDTNLADAIKQRVCGTAIAVSSWQHTLSELKIYDPLV
jgi:phosphomannomutase